MLKWTQPATLAKADITLSTVAICTSHFIILHVLCLVTDNFNLQARAVSQWVNLWALYSTILLWYQDTKDTAPKFFCSILVMYHHTL